MKLRHAAQFNGEQCVTLESGKRGSRKMKPIEILAPPGVQRDAGDRIEREARTSFGGWAGG